MKTYLQECLNYHSNVKPITCLWLTIVMLYTLAQTSTALPVSRNALIKDNVQLEEDILDTYLSVHRINSFMKSVKELHRLGGIDSRDFAISDPVNPSLPISFIKRSEGRFCKYLLSCLCLLPEPTMVAMWWSVHIRSGRLWVLNPG